MIAVWFLRFNCNFSHCKFEIHTSDNLLDKHNDGINRFMLSNSSNVFIWKFFLTYLLDVGVLCVHSSTIVTPSRGVAMYSPEKASSTWSWWYRFNRGIIMFRKLHGLIITTKMIVVEWKLTKVLYQEQWLAAPPCTHGRAYAKGNFF